MPKMSDEVVISGITGRFPNCSSVEELREKLMAKEDVISDEPGWRRDKESKDVPKRMGKISGVEKFDASFFGIDSSMVEMIDPSGRILLEQSIEAIIDAGINPAEIRGKKIAVVIGYSSADSEVLSSSKNHKSDPNRIPNRISQFLDIHGPSYMLDVACSSSALDHCYKLLKAGECEGALVGGSSLLFHPNLTLKSRLGAVSVDSKTFDESADGYVRSEAVTMLYLQRAKDAKRIYATVIHCKTNSDGHKAENAAILQSQFLRDFYQECKVHPTEVSYMEAHGKKIDAPQEILSVDSLLCENRKKPLKIGSVQTNIGHTEAASTLSGILKVIIAMETNIIPPNLNEPRGMVRGVLEKKVQVVTEPTPWKGGYAGIGGTNAHVLLKSHTKEKVNNGAPRDDLPRLIVVSGRTEEAVKTLLDSVENMDVDVEYVRLLHGIYAYNTPKHEYRGYTIVGSKHRMHQHREIATYDETITRPIWFVFSGMGSQWPGMGKMLMRFPVFAEAISKCDADLKPRGIDIVHIITTDDKSIVNNILNCFVGITAIQIGLVDLLKAAGIMPDNLIGYSVGAFGSAYCDGSFTARETIRSAYAQGKTATEYNKNDLKSIDMIEEKASLIPSNAICIEITPHGLFKEILTRSRRPEIMNISLIQRDYKDNAEFFVQALGKLYNLGHQLKLANIYPSVSLPVSRGTPMISPHIRWDHSADWYVPKCGSNRKVSGNLSIARLSTGAKGFDRENQSLGLIKTAIIRMLDITWSNENYIEHLVPSSTTDTKIIFLPGIDGDPHVFSTLTEHLLYSSISLYLPYEEDCTKIDDIIKLPMLSVLESLRDAKRVLVVGYSFGSVPAIEVARKLQTYCYDTQLMLLDGSPDAMEKIVSNTIGTTTEEELENKLVLSIAETLCPAECAKITKEIMKCSTLDEKLNVLNESPRLTDEEKSAFEALARRMYATITYDIKYFPLLEVPTTLLKATQGIFNSLNVNHGLEKIISGKVRILDIEGDHVSILANQRVSTIINDALK